MTMRSRLWSLLLRSAQPNCTKRSGRAPVERSVAKGARRSILKCSACTSAHGNAADAAASVSAVVSAVDSGVASVFVIRRDPVQALRADRLFAVDPGLIGRFTQDWRGNTRLTGTKSVDKANQAGAQLGSQRQLWVVIGFQLLLHVIGHDTHHVVHALDHRQLGVGFGLLQLL